MVRTSWAIAALLLPLTVSSKFTIPLTPPDSAKFRGKFPNVIRHAPVGLAGSGFVNLAAFNWEFSYSINITIGTPPQPLTLIFDSGSSNVVIPSKDCSSLSCGSPVHTFDASASKTYKSSGKKIDMYYGTGEAHGVIGTDVLGFGGQKIKGLGVGLMVDMSAIITQMGNDGIIGFGPDAGSVGNQLTPLTLMYKQGIIKKKVYSIFFQPVSGGQRHALNGEITFGGVDNSKMATPMHWVPISTSKDVSGFWGIDAEFYAGSKLLGSKVSGFVDTGTTLVNVSPTIGNAFFAAIKGSKRDPSSGLYSVPCDKLDTLPNFTLKIGGKLFSLSARNYVLPSYQNPDFMQQDKSLCLSYIQTQDSGFSFILGAKWLEHFAVGFDAGANKIGFAPTKVKTKPTTSTKITGTKTTSTSKPTSKTKKTKNNKNTKKTKKIKKTKNRKSKMTTKTTKHIATKTVKPNPSMAKHSKRIV